MKIHNFVYLINTPTSKNGDFLVVFTCICNIYSTLYQFQWTKQKNYLQNHYVFDTYSFVYWIVQIRTNVYGMTRLEYTTTNMAVRKTSIP